MVSQLIKVSPVVICNKVPTEAGAQEAQVADTRHNYDNDNYKNYDVGWILLSALQHLREKSDKFKSTESQHKLWSETYAFHDNHKRIFLFFL